jgi:hypothetical protein
MLGVLSEVRVTVTTKYGSMDPILWAVAGLLSREVLRWEVVERVWCVVFSHITMNLGISRRDLVTSTLALGFVDHVNCSPVGRAKNSGPIENIFGQESWSISLHNIQVQYNLPPFFAL